MLVFWMDAGDVVPCTAQPKLYNVHFVSYIRE